MQTDEIEAIMKTTSVFVCNEYAQAMMPIEKPEAVKFLKFLFFPGRKACMPIAPSLFLKG